MTRICNDITETIGNESDSVDDLIAPAASR